MHEFNVSRVEALEMRTGAGHLGKSWSLVKHCSNQGGEAKGEVLPPIWKEKGAHDDLDYGERIRPDARWDTEGSRWKDIMELVEHRVD